MSNNYIKLRKCSLFYYYYAYVDYADKKMADKIFIDHKITVHFKGDYIKDESPYMIVLCRIRKRDAKCFEQCLENLANSCDGEYAEFCKWFENIKGEYDNV